VRIASDQSRQKSLNRIGGEFAVPDGMLDILVAEGAVASACRHLGSPACSRGHDAACACAPERSSSRLAGQGPNLWRRVVAASVTALIIFAAFAGSHALTSWRTVPPTSPGVVIPQHNQTRTLKPRASVRTARNQV
jgi:hypothetical protein